MIFLQKWVVFRVELLVGRANSCQIGLSFLIEIEESNGLSQRIASKGSSMIVPRAARSLKSIGQDAYCIPQNAALQLQMLTLKDHSTVYPSIHLSKPIYHPPYLDCI